MAYREVSVTEIREVLRLWLAGHSLREVTRLAGLDRKTVRRYVQAAEAAGVSRGGGDGQLTEELLGAVVAVVRPDRLRGNGASWEAIAKQREQITAWLKQDLTLAKIHMLLGRRGVVVPYRTLHRFAVAELGFGRRQATVRVADGKPGQEVQVDFGQLGLLPEPATGRRRVAQGLIFTAVYSRHMFGYPTLRQTLEDVVAGFEAAWVFFGGVFAIVVPDNMKAIVDHADASDPRLNDAFREYAQARGFVVDPARVRHPRDNSIVERWIQTCRHELIDRTLIWNQRHLLHALREYERFYNSHRPHQGIANARPSQPLPEPLTDPAQITRLDIRRRPRLGGILKEYHHVA
jgi:transposase